MSTQARRKLPIGIQTFREIRTEGHYYVDKTAYVARLAEGGKYYFLSRPRRFGKSLFLDTLAEAFNGNRALFGGLYLEGNWDWGRKHPIVRLSFAGGVLRNRAELDKRLGKLLQDNAKRLGVDCGDVEDVAGCLDELIMRAAERHGERVVVLVDEYDKPILDNLERPEVARELRDGLRNAYSVLKARDAELRFVFLTGVSKFSKVSIFSGLNNLLDITLDSRYAAICGYTDADIGTVFAPELDGLERAQVREWYNGYSWGGERVYNPFDVLLLFDKREFRPHWFETGTPGFLVEWLKGRRFHTPQLEQCFADDELLSAFDVDGISTEAMLWQTGYLTIRSIEPTLYGRSYTLGVPNHEVRTALNRSLLGAWLPNTVQAMQAGRQVYRALAEGDLAALRAHFERLYAGIPHDWYRNSPIAQYEGYYASVFYSHLAALGLDIVAEDVSSQGQCDLVIRHGNRVYVVEFKVEAGDSPSGSALAQLQSKGYAAKYRAPGVEVVELGITFSRSARQIVGWEQG